MHRAICGHDLGYTNSHARTHARTHTCTHIRACMHTTNDARTHSRRTHAHTTHAHTQARTHTHACTHTHARTTHAHTTHARTHSRMHAHTHARTHAHLNKPPTSGVQLVGHTSNIKLIRNTLYTARTTGVSSESNSNWAKEAYKSLTVNVMIVVQCYDCKLIVTRHVVCSILKSFNWKKRFEDCGPTATELVSSHWTHATLPLAVAWH